MRHTHTYIYKYISYEIRYICVYLYKLYDKYSLYLEIGTQTFLVQHYALDKPTQSKVFCYVII